MGDAEVAAVYTHGHAESVLRSHRWRTAANSAAYLLPRLAAGQRLLDVGCGPGTLTVDLARQVAPGEVVAVDASAEVVAAAAEAVAAAGTDVAERVSVEVGDAYALGFEDDSFDVVHAHQVLQHLADPVAALAEWRRVCRPGGVVAARDGDYAAFTWAPASPLLDRWLEVYSAVARANRGEPDAGRHLLGWAHAAGFTEVTASASVWCFAAPDERAWWSELWAERTEGTALAERAVELGLSTQAELDEVAAAWRAWGQEPDGWFAVLHGEILATA